MRLVLRSFAGFFFPFLLACSSVDSVEVPEDLVSACEGLFARRMAYAQRCSGPAVAPLATEAQAYVDSCIGIATAPGVTLTVADVTACADQMDAARCLGGNVFPACAGYGADLLYPNHDKKGSLTPGEACFAAVQCDSGYCDNLGKSCGVCQRARALGESCGDEQDRCVEGECLEGSCQLPGMKLGEDCIDYPGVDCQVPLYCKHVAPDHLQGKCVPRPVAGGACDAATPCVGDLACHSGVCVALLANGANCVDSSLCTSRFCHEGACAPLPTGLTEGDDCSVGFCRADLLCDDGHVCRQPAIAPAGGACTQPALSVVRCAPGLYCHVTCTIDCDYPFTGICEALPQAGELCSNLLTCAAGALCVVVDFNDPTKDRCVKLGGPGEACPCSDELACVGGACVAYGASICQ